MRRRAPPTFPDVRTPQDLAAATLFRSRWPQLPPSADQAIAETQIGQRQRAFEQAPIGEPRIDVDVRSVYDVRPINAHDGSLVMATGDLTGGAEAGAISATVATPVPLGYVFVLRHVAHYLDPIPVIASTGEVLVTVQKQQTDVEHNVDIPVGAQQNGELLTTFVIYDENESVGARVTINSNFFFTTQFHATFYGNFLRKTGRSANLEIGNPARGSASGA